jgi:hypothetical protein
MSKREPKTLAEAIMLTPAPSNKDITEGVRRLTDAQLVSWSSIIAGLCNNEPVPSSTVALVKAKRVFDRYWGKYANRN